MADGTGPILVGAAEPNTVVGFAGFGGLCDALKAVTGREPGLSDDHDMSTDCYGRPVSKTHQTMGIGNMVPREPAASLIRTQCPDMIETPQEREAA